MVDHAIYSEEAGSFVSSKLQRLAEILADYDSNLELRWIPPQNRSSDDSLPYCIVHQISNYKPYVVLYFSELDDPVDILAKIFEGDNKNKNVLSLLERKNAAAEAFRLKEQIEVAEESAEMAKFLLKSPKNYINWKDRTTGEKIKLDSERRRV